jgi:hypothetical protein
MPVCNIFVYLLDKLLYRKYDGEVRPSVANVVELVFSTNIDAMIKNIQAKQTPADNGSVGCPNLCNMHG